MISVLFLFSDFNEDDCERELEHCKKQLQEITSNFEFLKETLVKFSNDLLPFNGSLLFC